MRFDYDAVEWTFPARILDENSVRLSRTRSGVSDVTVSAAKRPLLLDGEALARRAAANEARAQRFLFETRRDPPPQGGRAVLQLLWRVADTINDGLVNAGDRLRRWPSCTQPPAPRTARVDFAELPAALERFAEIVHRRWPELADDPVSLASWAEWELNGGGLHPFYDGCGRISRCFGALLLLRASWLLPLYDDCDSYFVHGHAGPAPFAAYVRERIAACAGWLGSVPEM